MENTDIENNLIEKVNKETEKFVKLINWENLQDIKECYLEHISQKTPKFRRLTEKYNFILLVLNTSYNSDILKYFINEYDDKLSKQDCFNFGDLVIKFSKNIKDYKALYTVMHCKFVTRKNIDIVFYPAIFEAIVGNNTEAFNLLKFKASAKLTFYSNNKIKEFKKYMNIIDVKVNYDLKLHEINDIIKLQESIKLQETESDTESDSELEFDCIDKSEC